MKICSILLIFYDLIHEKYYKEKQIYAKVINKYSDIYN